MNTKDAVIQMIQNMPESVSWADIVAEGQEKFGSVDNSEELTQEEWDEAWAREINRRVEDLESGKVKGIPAEKVFRQIDEKLARMHQPLVSQPEAAE